MYDSDARKRRFVQSCNYFLEDGDVSDIGWSISFARNQWRYVHHIIDGNFLMWSRVMCKYHFNSIYDPASLALPRRSVGHPRLRWDDHIHNLSGKYDLNIADDIGSISYRSIVI